MTPSERALGVPGIRDAAWSDDSSGGAVLFVVVEDDVEHRASKGLAKEQLWGRVFDDAYAKAPTALDPRFNPTSYDSIYTGKALGEAELRPVIEGTVRRALALRGRRVLEIGCGMGMVLFGVAPHSERYVGIDLSEAALAHVGKHLGDLSSRVELRRAGAMEIEWLPAGTFDLVVVNETVQYFPSVAYLIAVLRRAERLLAPGGCILLGDLRSTTTAGLLYDVLACARAASDATAADLRGAAKKVASQERELLLDPCIVHTLGNCLPRLTSASVALHDVSWNNELTQFRFNALLSFDRPRAPGPIELLDAPGDRDLVTIVRDVARSASMARRIAFRSLPNARLSWAHRARRWLASAADDARLADVVGSFGAPDPSAVLPERIVALGSELARRVAVSPASRDREGRFDVVMSAADDDAPEIAAGFDCVPCAHSEAASLLTPDRFAFDRDATRARAALEAAVKAAVQVDVRVFPVARIPRDAAGVPDIARLRAAMSLTEAP